MAMYDAQTAASLAADPQTPAQTLADIAGEHPELWGELRQHPSMYPGLAQWIDDAQAAAAPLAQAQPVEPAAQAGPQQYAAQAGPAYAFAQQTNAYTEQPTPGQAMPQGNPGQQGFPDAQAYGGYAPPATPQKRKTGLIIGIAAAAAVALAGIGIAIPLTLGAGGGSGALSSGLKLIEAPEGDFTLNMVDTAALERAMGEPFPRDGSQREIEEWSELSSTGSREIVSLASIGIDTTSPELASLFFESGGVLNVYDRETSEMTGVLPGAVSDARLTELLGRPSGGVWEAETFDSSLYLAQVDTATYFSPYEEELPNRQPEAGSSAAADPSITDMLSMLQRSGGYAYIIERDDYPADQAEELTGERVDRIEVYGSALSLRDGQPLLTLAYDFGSDAKARANLDLMREAFGISADGLGQDDPLDVRQQGTYVVAEFELSGDDLNSVAFDLRNLFDS